jgi:hypothetical protein
VKGSVRMKQERVSHKREQMVMIRVNQREDKRIELLQDYYALPSKAELLRKLVDDRIALLGLKEGK